MSSTIVRRSLDGSSVIINIGWRRFKVSADEAEALRQSLETPAPASLSELVDAPAEAAGAWGLLLRHIGREDAADVLAEVTAKRAALRAGKTAKETWRKFFTQARERLDEYEVDLG